MAKTCLTTSDLRPPDRMEFWQEVVCKKYVSATAITDVAGESFFASLQSREIGPLVVSEMRAPLHFWSRKAAHVNRDGQEVYIVSRLTHGAGEIEQFGRSVRHEAGDLVLYDAAAPFDYTLRASTQLIKIPKRLLDAHVERPKDFIGFKIDARNPLSPALSNILSEALEGEAEGTADRKAVEIVDLLASIFDIAREPAAALRPQRLVKAMHFARARLDQGDLTPKALAAAAGISVRTLNRLFGAQGTTPMRWVWAQRLAAGRDCLLEGRAHSVTEAAFMHGFTELAHFSRSFKRAYGVAPHRLMRK